MTMTNDPLGRQENIPEEMMERHDRNRGRHTDEDALAGRKHTRKKEKKQKRKSLLDFYYENGEMIAEEDISSASDDWLSYDSDFDSEEYN